MSSFIREAVNPKTGKKVKAYFIDDYYGKHQYAIAFRRDDTDADITDGLIYLDYDFYKESEI
jgi:hypothetical protein